MLWRSEKKKKRNSLSYLHPPWLLARRPVSSFPSRAALFHSVGPLSSCGPAPPHPVGHFPLLLGCPAFTRAAQLQAAAQATAPVLPGSAGTSGPFVRAFSHLESASSRTPSTQGIRLRPVSAWLACTPHRTTPVNSSRVGHLTRQP